MSFDLSKVPEQFFDLTKQAHGIVAAKGLEGHKAKVTVVMDISGSMSRLYQTGRVKSLIKRLLPLGIIFDDNAAIDYFTFGQNAHYEGEMRAEDFDTVVDKIITSRRLEGNTLYAKPMELVLDELYPETKASGGGLFKKAKRPDRVTTKEPAYVMFVTDGNNNDRAEAEALIKVASAYPVFWQFIGIGGASFEFLEKLDDLGGRVIDNANFQNLGDFSALSDQELYECLMDEYPDWLQAARREGIAA